MRLNINGKSDSNQNFDLNSNFPSWRFVRNKVHEEGMVLSENLRHRRSSQQSGSYQNQRILPRKKGAKFIEKVCSDLNVKLKSALTAICKDGPKVIVKMGKILGIIYTHCMAQSLH